MRLSSPLLLLLSCLLLLSTCIHAHYCLNEDGKSVDWWMISKVPKLYPSHPLLSSGGAYLYADASSVHNGPNAFWRNSSLSLVDDRTSLSRTLQQIYDARTQHDSHGHIIYNDDPPEGGPTSSSFAHAKGLLAWSAQGSFWLIHSVPRLGLTPHNNSRFSYPSSGLQNGQSFLCVSMDLANVDLVFKQLQYMNPQISSSQWVQTLAAQLPNGHALLNLGKTISGSASNVETIRSMGGVKFTHFSKTRAWGQSIFGDLIGKHYDEDMLVETWNRPYEVPLLPPESAKAVYSIRTLGLPAYANWGGVEYKESQDHSKWALILNPNLPVTCIGDLNKQMSQHKRGGGFLCLTDRTVYDAYKLFIRTTDQNMSKQQLQQEVMQSQKQLLTEGADNIALQ